MLDRFVRAPGLLRRLRSGVLGGVLDDFVGDLLARGHAARTIADYVREAERLAQWMDRNGRTVDTLSPSILEEFLADGDDASRKAKQRARAALRRLLVTLDAKGVVAPASSPAASPGDALVRQFLEHSTRCRGLSAATCQQQGRLVREFIAARFAVGAVDVGMITPHDLMRFVAARVEQGQTRSAKSTVSALRAFLRFLVLEGLCTDELVRAVPTVAHRGARLPRALTDEQVHRLLTHFDRSRPVGRRDHAIALCLVRLGLRIGEAVGLRLEDIAWRSGTLRIATGKSRRAAMLPLPADVGSAIAQYIRDGRPATKSRHVFVTHAVPVGAPLGASAARAALRRAFDRADVQVPSKGTNALRHTVATRMVCQGASLKDVADVLRHRSLDTTTVYARVDLPALRSVAMPWPEVRS